MAYPTYRQPFEGGVLLSLVCSELVDVDGTSNSIDTNPGNAFTGTGSLLHIGAAHFMASNVADTLAGNLTFSLYFRCATATASMSMYTRCPTLGAAGGAGSVPMSFGTGGINSAISGFSLPTGTIWMCAELRVNGTTGSYRVIRQDNGQFFVNFGSGSWSAAPQTVINSAISAAAAGGWAFGGGDPSSIWVDDLIIEPPAPVIDIPTFTLGSSGSTRQLTAGGFTDPLNRTGGPGGLAGTHVTWSTSNGTVATVSSTGLATAVFGGTATITATGKRDPGQNATATVTVTAPPLNISNWLYRLPVTIDNTANTTSALAYFQAHISLTGAAYTSFHSHAKADGSDLLITDSDGVTLLNFALEGIDNTNSVVYLIVKVPRVPAASTRTIYLYYGNAAANSLSSYPSTIGPATILIGPTDILTQTDSANLNNNSVILRLRHQDQSGGGGAGLNGEIHCYSNNQASNASVGNCKIWQLRSTDGGLTWPTKNVILTPAATFAASVQTVHELANGNILIYYQYDLTTNYSPTAVCHGYVARSTDGGRTWANLSTSPTNPMTVPSGYTTTGLPYGNAIEATPGGDILKCWYGVKTGNTVIGSYLLRCPSGSDPTVGTNWSLYGTIGYDGTNAFSETSVIQTSDANHLIAIMRNDTAHPFYQSVSTNGGSVWSAPVALTGPNAGSPAASLGNYSPFLLRLASGNLILFAGNRGNANSAGGANFWTSTDNGVSWYDRPGQNPWGYAVSLLDAGYPGADQRADGTIVAACYHEVGGNVDTTNIGCVVFTEDYAFNASNQYDACESFSGPWVNHEANLTIDSAHAHNGTNAIKGDNTSGHAMAGQRSCWSTDLALLPQGIAFSLWLYATGNVANVSWGTRVGNTLGSAGRTACYVDGTGATQHVFVYTGAAYTDSTVVAPLNQWNKHSLYINAPFATSALSGTHARFNNTVLTPIPGNVGATTGAPASVVVQFGNEGANSATTAWLDDFYTHQFTANIPIVTAGSEQSASSGSVAVTLAPDVVTATAVALPPRTAPAAVALAPDTVTATAVTFLPKLAAAAITLAPDTVTAHALAVVPGAATAVGSFTLRADLVTCIAQPFVQTTSTYLLIDPEQTTRL